MSPLHESVVRDATTMHGIPLDRLLSKCRWPNVVAARRMAAVTLDRMGLSSVAIGRALGRNHESILYLLGRTGAARRKMFAGLEAVE